MNAWHSIKDHPWLAGAVVGIVLLFLVFRGSGSNSAVSAGAPGGDPNGDALATAQLQAQTTIAGYNAAASAQAQQVQGSLELATIQSKSNDFANTLAAEVALSNIGASADVAKNTNAMNTAVALGSQHTQEALASINSNTQIQSTSLLTGAMIAQSQISAQTAQAYIGAASAAANKSCDSYLWGAFSSC